MMNRLKKACGKIREYTDMVPEIGIVLGSGLGNYAKCVEVTAEVPYSGLEGFPVSTVPGHEGKYIFGRIGGVSVVLMKGRIHYYEGYEMEDVVLPIRLMGLLGIKKLILTNAAGAVDLSFSPGELMLITDHISALIPSVLRGPNHDELGVRFPDMSKVYDPEMRKIIKEKAAELGVTLREGVYLQWRGPAFETPAEIRMFRSWGANAVGMSTVCEAVAARHMGIRIAGISCLTNMAAGILDQPLSHEEVQECADRVHEAFESLITESVKAMAEV